jgi:hypothetical protein
MDRSKLVNVFRRLALIAMISELVLIAVSGPRQPHVPSAMLFAAEFGRWLALFLAGCLRRAAGASVPC